MSDLSNASLFFLIFGVVLTLYGARLNKTGDKNLMPIQTVHSIRGPQDVRRVGKIVSTIGLAISVVSIVLHRIAG